MSCLNLRLPTARKAWSNWKSLTSKIQSKLHKLNKPKAINKPRSSWPKTAPSRPYCKVLGSRFQRKRCPRLLVQPQPPKSHLFLIQNPSQCHVLQKGHAPVYVDKLFKGSVSERVDRFLQPLPPKSPGSSNEGGNGAERTGCTTTADDMWEAIGFASPQMRGIDERAKQFIAKFRAEMEVQEMMDSDLW